MAKLTIKNRERELRFFQKRLSVIAILVIILTFGLIVRLWYLQVVERKLYSTLSVQNQLNFIPIAPKRGLIYDRNGTLLAKNIPVFSLDIIPDKVPHIKKTIMELKQILPITNDNQHAFYRALRQKRPYEPTPLKVKLTPAQVAIFSVNRWRFPGVIIKAQLIRNYPLGKSTTSVLGYMGRITAAELKHVNSSNYSATNYIGKVGIEKYYQSFLHGKVGYEKVETDASGRIVRVLKRVPPIAGDNLYLTIDAGLEKITQKAFKGQEGAAVAIQPSTGEVLALVSHPSYNPNTFVTGISEKKYRKLQMDPNRPLFNRAIRGLYAPGSTIKPYYGLEGLMSHIITPAYAIYDPGYFKYGGHTYLNYFRPGFGWVDLKKAIIVSDDTYFYHLAVNMGVKHMDKLLKSFGFGQPTNIEIGEELGGVVPTPTWKKKHTGRPWYTGDTINMGIGQGYLLVTPLQMATAVATLAEHGKRFQPHLLLKLETPNGINIIQTPTQLSTIKIPKNDWHTIINAMQGVINAHNGTGWRFGRKAPYTAAAKTGTAQVYTVQEGGRYTEKDMLNENKLPKKLRDDSLFIVFAPIQHPKIAVAVVVEHAETAPIVARKMLNYYLLTQKHLYSNETAN